MCFAIFPFANPGEPGPSPHIVLCAATGRQGKTTFAIVFYTTTQTDYQGTRRPRQYLFVSESRAKELGQRAAFHVDASRIARFPLTTDYFPQLSPTAIQVIARDPNFVATVEERLSELINAGIEIRKIDAV